MKEKYGIFEVQDVDIIGSGQECLVKLDEVSVEKLANFEGRTEQEKVIDFINRSPKISLKTNCKVLKFWEFRKTEFIRS